METRRWTNPSQPQTLQIAVWLLYLNAGFGLLLGRGSAYFLLGEWFGAGVGTIAVIGSYVGMAAAGFGIANDRRWGYRLGVGLTVGEVVLLVVLAGNLASLLSFGILLALLFAGARAALLLHPMSRDYQRVWFR